MTFFSTINKTTFFQIIPGKEANVYHASRLVPICRIDDSHQHPVASHAASMSDNLESLSLSPTNNPPAAAAKPECCSTLVSEKLAIKIYKTSILVFKDRDRYVTGEYRFRHGYCKV